ncbi:MAG: TCP-1/cpn60 chaperonin family protein [Candidatus Diapherotrites archaeon]|uniref:TCP-1/cpn60 chaperonin family protein n=1 Tax=Candidatus Iainarchaeum sp. TaxID=3101447 RepID=A0A939C6R7_9ARCH|nr:TCP-1/cpn60 chaperonin family protein [Candidatus Diapherotrites archaeon]
MAEATQQPVVFLTEGTKRTRGRDAQRINILIAKAVANAVKSTLGPKGMDKMIVDDLGDVTISNDGATILDEMSIDHPAGKMMVEVAKTQDEEVGDGTTTAVVLAGTLLKNAEKLLDDEIHPSIIIKGYRQAAKKAKEIMAEAADTVSPKDSKTLRKIALTSMTGKVAESAEDLADLIVDAITAVAEEDEGKVTIDIDNVKVEKKQGAALNESKLVQGIIIDKEMVHSGMPKKVKNAKIALLDVALEIKSPETDAKIEITSPDQLQAFVDQEETMLRKMVEAIKKSGANFVVCQKGIDDLAQHFLAKEGISAVRRVKQSDMKALARATKGKVVSRINDLTASDLGNAALVEERKIAGDEMVFVEGCKNPKSVSVLVRGGSEHLVDEVERAVHDALMSVADALKDGKIVSGGGSIEEEASVKLREFAQTIGGKEQLAIEAFADTLEEIPRTLAETAGMDPLDTIVNLRAKHKGKDGKHMGVDVFKQKIMNMKDANVIEPLSVKTQAITSGAEVAEMILRIDDIIAGTSKGKGMPPGGMPPGGMGGMDMGM